MIRKIVIAIVCLVATGLYAQDGTVSPYSFFGIGDLRSTSTVENQMMGSIGIYADSIHVNLKNPAAYGKLGVNALGQKGITTYTAGISNNQVRLQSSTTEERNSVANLDYLSLAFSLGKGFGIGFGLTPFSSVGYNTVGESNNENGDLITNVATGEGGLNRVYLSLGYELMKNLTIGATANFNFGTLENRRLQSVANVQLATQDVRTSRVNGADFNYALNYTPSFKDKYTLFTSLRVNTQANLTSKNTQRLGSFDALTGRDVEIIDVNLDAQGRANTDLKIPTTVTLGLGFGQDKKWFLGGEYSFQGLSSFTNEFLAIDNVAYQDASSIALGGFYIPDYNTFSGYFKRITYRAGVRFDKTGLIVNDTEIDNFGITFGVGLPLGRSFSNVNIGFEIGKRGTTSADLIEENYFRINLGLSFNDLWFRKRKLN